MLWQEEKEQESHPSGIQRPQHSASSEVLRAPAGGAEDRVRGSDGSKQAQEGGGNPQKGKCWLGKGGKAYVDSAQCLRQVGGKQP